jgi:aminopeptidase N
MRHLIPIFSLLILLAGSSHATTHYSPDRSWLWRSEEVNAHLTIPGTSDDGHRDTSYGYDVDHIDLEMAVHFDPNGIVATAHLQITITEAGLPELAVDLHENLVVSQVTVAGSPTGFIQTTHQVIVALTTPPDPGTQLVLGISYSGLPLEVGNKSLRFRTHLETPIVYTLSTPYSNSSETVIPVSHHWRACKDVPDDKSTFNFDVTVPDTMLACSNGIQIGDQDNGDGTRTFSWSHDYPVAPYLITFAATNYQIMSDTYSGPGGSADIQHFVYPERYSQAQVSWDLVVPTMELFATLFGEYPFIGEKYGMYCTPGGPAVEEQTMVAFPYNLITGAHQYDYIVVHELAHMWWGDCVTCESWADVWLNEGFASYAEALWQEDLGGPSALRSYMLNMDSGPWDVPIYDPPYVWNSVVYDKGAWVLHMLRRIVGDPVFFQILIDYRAAHEHANATTADLIAVAEASYGGDLNWFFDPWIHEVGRPSYHYTWECQGSGPYNLHLVLEQTQSLDYPTYKMPIDLRLLTSEGLQTITIVDSLRHQVFDLPLENVVTGIGFDPDRWLLGSFHPATTGIDATVPSGIHLDQNFPNPFNPTTRIIYSLSQKGVVALRIFDARGRLVRTLLRQSRPAGEGFITWDGRDDQGAELPSGVYLYRLAGPDGVQSRKMVLAR